MFLLIKCKVTHFPIAVGSLWLLTRMVRRLLSIKNIKIKAKRTAVCGKRIIFAGYNQLLIIIMDKPAFVYREGMTADKGYVAWLADVKTRLRQNQIKASIRVNTAMLEFYWSIGRDLVAMRAEERWGAGVVKQFALDMRQSFPEMKGFSYSNVKYMRQWYLFYYERVKKGQQVAGQIPEVEIGQQLVDKIEVLEKGHQVGDQIGETEKSHQVGGQIEMPEVFGKIPWKHHISIISQCESLDEALFYIGKVSEEGWSRSTLEHKLATRLYQTQGAAVRRSSPTSCSITFRSTATSSSS